MRSSFKPRALVTLAAASIACCGVMVGLGGATAPVGASSSVTASSATTLIMESSPENTITQDFNPYIATGGPYQMGATGLIYEPLIEFDLAAPPKYYPWLASAYHWANGGKSIVFTIRKGVKWNNGTAFTPADVAFTYNLVKGNASINTAGLDIKSVSTSGDNVTVSFATAQYTNLQQVAGIGIVPKSIWSTAGNPATFTDATPVGTGPYTLGSFTPQGFTLVKNPHYWRQKVSVQNVYFPVYTSNTSAAAALFAGQIDWTGNFIAGLQKNFVDKAPAYHHYWEAAGSTNALFPNTRTWPTDKVAVRRAISLAVNRTVIAAEGEAGLENPVLNATGLTLPTFAAWSGPVKSLRNAATSRASAARNVLKSAGFKIGKNGWFERGGRTVSITLISPSSYTDYAEVGSIVAGELRAAGIDANFQGLTVSAWSNDIADGDFQLSEHWANNGLTPYNMYDGWLNDALDTKSATGDYERLHATLIDADLAKLAGAATTAKQTADLVPIEKYVAANLPVIPVTTASEWFEYNSQRFVGWPTMTNPYETGQPSGTNNGPGSGTDLVVILRLRPRG